MPVQRTIFLNELGEASPTELIFPGQFRCVETVDEDGISVVTLACHPSDNYGEIFVLDGTSIAQLEEHHADSVGELLTDEVLVGTFGETELLEDQETMGVKICEHPLVSKQGILATLIGVHVAFNSN